MSYVRKKYVRVRVASCVRHACIAVFPVSIASIRIFLLSQSLALDTYYLYRYDVRARAYTYIEQKHVSAIFLLP